MHAHLLPAGGDDRQRRAADEELLGQIGDGADDVLAVVEQEQGILVLQVVDQHVEDLATGLLAQTEGAGDGARNAAPVVDGCQVHEPHAAAMAVEQAGPELERQARLAAAPGPRQGEHARLAEQLLQDGQLGLATDEARQLHGKVVRDVLEGPQGRELVGQRLVDELEDVLGSAEVPEAVRAEVLQAHVVQETVGDEVVGHLGQDDLAPVGGVTEAGGPVEGGPHVIALVP